MLRLLGSGAGGGELFSVFWRNYVTDDTKGELKLALAQGNGVFHPLSRWKSTYGDHTHVHTEMSFIIDIGRYFCIDSCVIKVIHTSIAKISVHIK